MLITEFLYLLQMAFVFRNVAGNTEYTDDLAVHHNRYIDHADFNGIAFPVDQPAFKNLGETLRSQLKTLLSHSQFIRINNLSMAGMQQAIIRITR
ncbi:hypothetical protein D3C73_983970 [compost metagenome]